MTLLECQEMSSSKPDKEIHLQVSEVDLAASPGSRAFKTSLDKVEEVQGNKASETYSKNLRNSLVVHNKEVEAREDKALEEDSKVGDRTRQKHNNQQEREVLQRVHAQTKR